MLDELVGLQLLSRARNHPITRSAQQRNAMEQSFTNARKSHVLLNRKTPGTGKADAGNDTYTPKILQAGIAATSGTRRKGFQRSGRLRSGSPRWTPPGGNRLRALTLAH